MKRGRGLLLLTKALDDENNAPKSLITLENVVFDNYTALEDSDKTYASSVPLEPLPTTVSNNYGWSNQDIVTTECLPESVTEVCSRDQHIVNYENTLGAMSNNDSSSNALESDFDSDDSVLDKDYYPPTQKGCETRHSSSEPESDNSIIPNSQQQNVRISESPSELEDTTEEAEQNDQSIVQEQLTKKGTVRKRKYFKEPLAVRKKLRKEIKTASKFYVKPGCTETCKKRCSTKIKDEYRLVINKHFTSMEWTEQKYFLKHHTSQTEPKRRRERAGSKINRSATNSYFLLNDRGEKVNVCKIFFLTTLGFNQKNDKALRNALKQNPAIKPQDNRGANPNPNKKNNDVIVSHILSFNPSVSHYRRHHAPNKRYLPSDLNRRMMYNDFCEKHGITNDSPRETHVSYEHYRKLIKSLDISFAKLGNEECDICEKYNIHNPISDIRHRNCEKCIEFEKHHTRYVKARQKYNEDKERQKNNKADPECDTIYYSVDLEKVIMLPRMDEFKIVMFCPRVILFNESFVPLGDKKHEYSNDTFACIWHEAISGRKKDDITSCFRAFFTQHRDLKHIVLWLDNCAAQNKNLGLFSYLLHIVNSNEVSFVSLTLKYLEVGHTYMSADEFHHQVELSLKRMKRLYDFDDFHAAVVDTSRKITVKKMDVSDFCKFEDCTSAYKLQNSSPRAYLNTMKEVIFRRGRNTLSYKNDFDDEEIELDFLRVKNLKVGIPKPVPKTEFRGIQQDRKSAIINKLLPLMPENRRNFWYNLHVNENVVDLMNEFDD